MNVELLSNGTLRIRAETELESYALDRWLEDWMGQHSEVSGLRTGTSTFSVETNVENLKGSR